MPEIPALGTTGKVGFRYMVNSRMFTQAIAYIIICLGQRRCVHQKGNCGKADGSLALSPHWHPPLSDSPRGPKSFTFIIVCLSCLCEACVYVYVCMYLCGQACTCRITRVTWEDNPVQIILSSTFMYVLGLELGHQSKCFTPEPALSPHIHFSFHALI